MAAANLRRSSASPGVSADSRSASQSLNLVPNSPPSPDLLNPPTSTVCALTYQGSKLVPGCSPSPASLLCLLVSPEQPASPGDLPLLAAIAGVLGLVVAAHQQDDLATRGAEEHSEHDLLGCLADIVRRQALNLMADLGGRPADPQLIEPSAEGFAVLAFNDAQAPPGEHEPDRLDEGRLFLRRQIVCPRTARLPALLVGIELDVPFTGIGHGWSTY